MKNVIEVQISVFDIINNIKQTFGADIEEMEAIK